MTRRGWPGCVPARACSLEGPYGTFTRERTDGQPTLFLAGGIGITPIRAMLEETGQGPRDDVLLYRARSWQELVFKPELDQLGRRPGTRIGYLVGRRGTRQMPIDPLTPGWLQQLVPDIRRRTVFLCGSGPFMDKRPDQPPRPRHPQGTHPCRTLHLTGDALANPHASRAGERSRPSPPSPGWRCCSASGPPTP